jgi:glyceraldehyde 3-phosphate dehydrogenase
VGLVLPVLNGKLDGVSIRVPTPNVSVIDFAFVAKKATSKERDQARRQQQLRTSPPYNEPNGRAISTTTRTPRCSTWTRPCHGRHLEWQSWYDEWGFSNRMADTAVAMGKLI